MSLSGVIFFLPSSAFVFVFAFQALVSTPGGSVFPFRRHDVERFTLRHFCERAELCIVEYGSYSRVQSLHVKL
jgi:hypothetical protein